MLTVQIFPFSPYQENTMVVSDGSGECVIIDPGCYTSQEQTILSSYIEKEGLKVSKLINTHGHIDHMLGNKFVMSTYEVPFYAHQKIIAELDSVPGYASMMGMNPDPSPHPTNFLDHGDTVGFGNTTFDIFFTPGHSVSHISLYHAATKELFSGDVLFQGSIGRTDLPGGSFEVLMQSIFDHLLPLDDDVTVYPGHGPTTTIGAERVTNMFIQQYAAQSGRAVK